VDWKDPTRNHFLAVNQLPVHGNNDRRPDIVIFVNGLPLVVFELKNPFDPQYTVEKAQNQLRHYVHEIPQLFDFNALVVASDGVTTQHAMWGASDEWFAPWNSIDGNKDAESTTAAMKRLLEGLFPKDRLLQYIRNFIVFEEANDRITKKGAKYHQFFAVQQAVERTLNIFRSGSKDKRLGVIWHTTGSGKSLSMLFLVGILRRHSELKNPSFVIQVDRTDLDDQLHDQFVAGRSLVGAVSHAEDTDNLRDLLSTQGGEVIFTTLEKFRLKRDAGEVRHPLLSDRSDIIIIADEAHRSQYGFASGYARFLKEALPHARRLGFTGTPVNFSGADTVEVFGPVIHAYGIKQSQEDKATVRLFYEPRQTRLHLKPADVDAALADLTSGENSSELEKKKTRWTALAQLAGVKNRVEELAKDLLAHFKRRSETLVGKAMVVCMTRGNCVRMYDALTSLPGCPEVKVVMTGNLGEDPEAWSKAGHLTTKVQRDAIKARMINPEDPLQIVIVCDMWLTGTDIPCLHTLYVDKPMRGHNMIQAISRVNRVFRDKPHGLIVDYIGIGDALREATTKYAEGGEEVEPAPDVTGQGQALFTAALAEVRSHLPPGQQYGGWRSLTRVQLEDLHALVYGTLAENDERREGFLHAELRLSAAFLLVCHLEVFADLADEVIFYQRVRQQLTKALPGRAPAKATDHAVRDLVDANVEAEGVVDIYRVAGIERPNLSILDDAFLQTFKGRPKDDLRLKLLERLLRDELQRRERQNLAKTRSFRELLDKTLQRYHARLIDAAAVVEAMVAIRKDMEKDESRGKALNLAPDELAFYDAVTALAPNVYDTPFLRELIHDVVQSVKKNLRVDWTKGHKDDVKAQVRTSVRRILKRHAKSGKLQEGDVEKLVDGILKQAEALYADWPLAA
jgi:type I restriction enzyme R subunit